ncbi:hypothetical protein VR44_40650, partial [Streptomyces katrae]
PSPEPPSPEPPAQPAAGPARPGTPYGSAPAALARFAVSSHVLRALASTEPTPEGLRLVTDIRRSKRLLLLRGGLDAAPRGGGGG